MPDGGSTPEGTFEPPDAQDPLRVLVVDDHDLFRSGLRRLLENEAGLQVVADARGGDEAVRRAADLQPDVVVMDVNMPGMSGIEATREVLAVSPRSAVLMLTISDSADEVLEAVLAGASGYLLKGTTLSEITSAVRVVGAGQSTISPRLTGSLLERLRRQDAHDAEEPVELNLSERSLDVLELLVDGCDNAEIGKRLHLSPNTIKHHVSAVLKQLGVDNRSQAAVLAVRWGLLDARGGGRR